MEQHADPLDKVVAELERRRGELPSIARACGIPYDTVLRIKNRQNDPGYSKVRALHEHLFGPPELSESDPAAAADQALPAGEGARA